MSPTIMFATLALAVAAPQLKDRPNPASALVGMWKVEQWLNAGADSPMQPDIVHEFTADGRRVLHHQQVALEGRSYKLMPPSEPPAIDLFRDDGHRSAHFRAIYKVEKDTFTLCIGMQDGDRPTEFESTAANGWQLVKFRRSADRK